MPETWKAWAAGFVDGEGAIRINYNRISGQINLDIQVSQKQRAPLEQLEKMFGGKIALQQPKSGPKYIWYTYGRAACNALRQMRPYLVVKAAHADVAFAFQDNCIKPHGYNTRLTEEERAARLGYYKQMQSLQIKGISRRKPLPTN